MANGSSALQLLDLPPEHLSKDAPAAADNPAMGIEIAILSEAMADAAITICRATLDHRQTGEVDPAIKAAGASQIARVAMWQLDHELGDDDFIHKARTAGRCALRRYFTDGDFQRHGPAEAEMAIDLCLDHLLTIVGHVVRDERTLRAAWAN